jgi:RHS repeat-associated protein
MSNWNTTLDVPTMLYMGQTAGSIIAQSFSVTSSGALSVSDNYGNSFSLAVPTTAPGVSTTTLVGNSTTAVQETRVLAGTADSADVKLTYSVYKVFCQPAGVRLVISGTENRGASSNGVVKIVFGQRPVSTSGFRTIFSNKSGIGLGFDWSDSSSLNPTFNVTSRTLAYKVASTFSIDPVTITTSSANPFSGPPRPLICFANGYFIAFLNTNGYYYYSSSKDGITWSGLTLVNEGSIMSIWCSGATIYWAAGDWPSNYKVLYWNVGTVSSTGSINWSYGYGSLLYTFPFNAGNPSIAVNSTGGIFIFDEGYIFMAKSASASSWNVNFSTACNNIYTTQLVPLTAGKVACIQDSYYDNDKIGASVWSGSGLGSWSTMVYTSASNYWMMYSQAAAVGDTVYVAASTASSSGGYLLKFSGGSWASPIQLVSSLVDSMLLNTDGHSLLVVTYGSGTYDFQMTSSSDNGSTWKHLATVVSTPQPDGNLAGSLGLGPSGLVAFDWGAGSSSPYDVEFAAVPSLIPQAAYSRNSWSRPGLSPFESYFSESSDYVSPGNGLVSVEVGSLDLPGRGLDFAPSLVYSEPYAFRSGGSPFLYDNYTGASLGYGWSLNLPWLGTNYLHLTDGQTFPYSWSGNTFQYNGVTNFVLTKNVGGTYTLNMSSGTLYRFDTSKRLISITDRTGNNEISFSYGSNNYISQVTDTIGRVITFTYNTNNQLTSISEGQRTWTLGYTGNQLTSLADPISTDPVTTFQYAGTTGANAWLLSSVIWPTGGKVTYTYASAPVGTEVSTYYDTLRNVYYDATHLSESQSISSNLLNGQMVWSNSTISDGTTTREYLDYNFQSAPKSVMKIYAYDGTKTLQRIAETDSDSAGRTNATKIYFPGGTLLAESTYAYDNWGNLIYSKDNVGQQTWYSYANTNSANSFGSSGCSTSFYTQTISPNIHDLIVGQCDYENGSGSPQQQTYNEYASNGNLLEEKVSHNSGWLYTDYTYDSYGNVLTTKNANGYTTYYGYSSTYGSAYLTKQSILVGTQNVTKTYTYNSNTGDMLSETDPNGQTTSYQYDALDRVTLITYPAIGGVSTYTYYYYYGGNNTMKTIDQNGHITKDYFDGLSRETEVQRWNGSAAYSAVYYTYNWLNEVATKTTAAGNTYTYYYDWDGQQTKLTNPDKSNETTSYDYVNNIKTVTDENGHQIVYSYDWNQRLITVKEYNSSTNYYLTTYSYDFSGNILSTTDAKNQQTSYQYDDLNRLTTTTFPTSPSTQETRTYDSMGNLQTRTTANGSQISYTYDALNRLTKVTYPGSGGTVTYTYDADGNKLSMVSSSATDYYTYDGRDRLTNQTEYVAGVKYQTMYAHDGVGDITSLTYADGYVLTMMYDGVNRLKKVGNFATIGYTVDDMISKITYGNGEVTTYTYDSRDRPTQILDKFGSTKELDLNYTYDGTGNVLTENTQSYGYDYLSRLTSSSGPWGSITYSYDQTGNRLKTVNGSTTTVYCYGAYNRLSSYSTSSCSSPTVSYTYDANGNMISKSGGWVYSYDYENRLVKVTHSGTTVQTNSYDGNGNRVQQVTGSSTFTYSYEGLNILYEKNVTGSTTTVTKHFYAGGLQVAKMVGTAVYYLHQDALGNTRLETTSTVTVKFSSNYVPYGKNYGMSGKEVLMYTGKMYDSATGLYYEGARYYDPTTGRFTIQDSITGTQEDPMSLNRYIYARDNPMKIVDLGGHEWYNPASWVSAASSVLTSTAAAATGVASAASNWWNSQPPIVQASIVTVAVVAVTVATAGVAAPAVGAALFGSGAVSFGAAATVSTVVTTAAVGATVGAAGSLAIGAATGHASPVSVLEGAGLGAVGGAISGAATSAVELTSTVPWGNTASGLVKTVAQAGAGVLSSSISAIEKTGSITPETLVGGAVFGAAGGRFGDYTDSNLGPTTTSALLSSGSVEAAKDLVSQYTGINMGIWRVGIE